jgi:hypothetical protein
MTPEVTPTPSTPIEIGGKVRGMRITFNALCLLEDRLDRSILEPTAWSNLRMRDVKLMLFASLRHEDATLTEAEVGRWLNMHNIAGVMAQLGKAWTASISGSGAARPLEIRETQ